MSLSHEHVGSKIPAKINTFTLTRAELLIHLCYEIPCRSQEGTEHGLGALQPSLWTDVRSNGLAI